MLTLFMDECGYTGQDLLSTEQPIFTMASLQASEEDCQAIKRAFFATVQAGELKFSKLTRQYRQRETILAFVKHMCADQGRVKVSIAHKRFVLLAKLVDLLIEPAMANNGIDLYDKGGNIALTNMLYHVLPVLGGPDYFDNLLRSFQNLIGRQGRESYQGREAYDSFYDALYSKALGPEIDGLFLHIRTNYEAFAQRIVDLKGHLDIAMSSAYTLSVLWRKDTRDPITLIYDDSIGMQRFQDVWNVIIAPDVPSVTVGYDRRTWNLRIGLQHAAAGESRAWAGLQLADVLAGAATRYILWLSSGQDSNDAFGTALSEAFPPIPSFPTHVIWPSTDVTPEALATTQPNAMSHLDAMGAVIHNANIAQER